MQTPSRAGHAEQIVVVADQRFDEPVLTLVEAAGWLERRFSRRPNVATIWRWTIKGVRGVRLKTIALGRFRYTTQSALERFIAETSENVPNERGQMPVEDRPDFSASELAAARRRREAEKERAKAFLRQNLGSSRGQATRRA